MRMRRHRTGPFLALSALALLAGCGSDTARTFGLTRDAPDEFQVTTRAPLSMPPSLGELPVPRPGASRPQEMTVRDQAEATLAPAAVLGQQGPNAPTAGEMALLSQAGRPVDDGIRQRVDQESLRVEQADRGLADKLMFWRKADQPGVAVDPRRESQRLRENAALGREPTEGETPIIQRARSSNPLTNLLESIF